MGASVPTGAVVLLLSVLLMHMRHAVADYPFYGLRALHRIGLVMAMN